MPRRITFVRVDKHKFATEDRLGTTNNDEKKLLFMAKETYAYAALPSLD